MWAQKYHQISPQYGNWYGPGWWGGASLPDRPGDKPPINSLDMLALFHDMAYDEAETQGAIYGKFEAFYLKVVADYFCYLEASDLPDDPKDWSFPPAEDDMENAKNFRSYMIVGFKSYSPAINLSRGFAEQYLEDLKKIVFDGEISAMRQAQNRLSIFEFRRKRDFLALKWISTRERQMEPEVDRLAGEINRELAAGEEKTLALCKSLRANLDTAALRATNALNMALSAERRFQGIAAKVSRGVNGNGDDDALAQARIDIDIWYEQMRTALEDAKYLAERCTSPADSQRAQERYGKAQQYLANINRRAQAIGSQLRSLDNCGKEVSDLASATKAVLAESDQALQLVYSARDSLKDRVIEADRQHQDSCQTWTKRIREYGWSKLLIGKLRGAVTPFCGQKCDFYAEWEPYRKVEADATRARSIVRRLSLPLESDTDCQEQMEAKLREIEAIKRTREKAAQTMASFVLLAQAIPSCANLGEQAARAVRECQFEQAERLVAQMPMGPARSNLEKALYEARERVRLTSRLYEDGKANFERARSEEAAGRMESASRFYQEANARFQQAKDGEICPGNLPGRERALYVTQRKIAELRTKPAQPAFVNISGTWRGEGNSTYHVTQTREGSVRWVGTGRFMNKVWLHDATGTISGNIVKAKYVDQQGSAFFPNSGEVTGTVSPDGRYIDWTGAFNPLEKKWKRD